MEGQPVTKAEWQDWKRSPVTKFLVYAYLTKLEYLKNGLIDGHFTGEEARLIAIGRGQSFKDAIDYIIDNFETIQEEIDA